MTWLSCRLVITTDKERLLDDFDTDDEIGVSNVNGLFTECAPAVKHAGVRDPVLDDQTICVRMTTPSAKHRAHGPVSHRVIWCGLRNYCRPLHVNLLLLRIAVDLHQAIKLRAELG
jgi:hypothetical protein